MDPSTFEPLKTFPIRDVSFSCKTSIGKEESCMINRPFSGPHDPLRNSSIPYCRVDVAIEDAMIADVPCISDETKVCTQFCRTRKTLSPTPLLPELWVREFVVWNGDVDSSAGVAVPVPQQGQLLEKRRTVQKERLTHHTPPKSEPLSTSLTL